MTDTACLENDSSKSSSDTSTKGDHQQQKSQKTGAYSPKDKLNISDV